MPSPGPIHVRPLSHGDRAAWQPLWEGYLGFYRAELDSAVTDHTFTRLCDPGEPALHGLLAVHGDDAVGLAHLVFHATTWSTEPRCYLEDLFVAREGRGGGVGEVLFEAVYAHARRWGAGGVYWHTQQFNAPARSLYDTVGRLTSFVVYERELPPA